MSLNRYSTRKDRNHKELLSHAESLGFEVKDVSKVPNFCDLILMRSGFVFFVEIKDGEKTASKTKLTKGEGSFKVSCERAGCSHVIAYSEKDINDLFKLTL